MNDEHKRRRIDPDEREQEIMQAALVLAELNGYRVITREQIAEYAKCSPSLVGKYFGDMQELRRCIMRAAVKQERAEVVLQGLVTRDPIALSAPEHVRTAAKNRLDDPHFTAIDDQ